MRRIKPPRPALRGEGWGEGPLGIFGVADGPLTRRFAPTSPRKRGEVEARFASALYSALQIQRLVMAKDAILVKGDAALAREIGFDVRPAGNAVVQSDQAGNAGLKVFHAFGKGV